MTKCGYIVRLNKLRAGADLLQGGAGVSCRYFWIGVHSGNESPASQAPDAPTHIEVVFGAVYRRSKFRIRRMIFPGISVSLLS